jgi:hypothetical protein
MENTNINQDPKLSQYRFEMNNESNDGWSKEHYRKMHEDRLKQLMKEDRKKEDTKLSDLGIEIHPWTSSNME